MEYREYLNSEAWKKRKERYYESHERKCKACGSRRKIHLHHKTYNRLGSERDADMVPMCERCHFNLHQWQRKIGKNLWLATEEFIRKKKSRIKTKRTVKRRSVYRRKKTARK